MPVPERDTQHALAQELSNFLGTEIETADSFFDYGGDSIDAIMASRINKQLDVAITAQDAFECSDIATLAERITPLPRSKRYVSIPRSETHGPVQQSFALGRLWFLEQLHPGSTWYLMPLATRLRGPLQLDALQAALSAPAERHETLRTTVDQQDGVGLQVVHPFHPKSLDVINMASSTDADLLRALHREHATVFDLSTEPG